MSAVRPAEAVGIAEWAVAISADAPDGPRASGSLYAVAPAEREAAATALAARGLNVHVDVVIDPAGRHRGLTPDEMRAARAAAPDARLEVHLIVDGAEPGADSDRAVGETIAAAIETRVAVVMLPPELCAEPGALVAALRSAGIAVWAAIGPHDAAVVPAGADGALVMLIEPGTLDSADPALVDRVAELSRRRPVGVDGGVTEELAERCIAAGATTIVAGRALFAAARTGEEQP